MTRQSTMWKRRTEHGGDVRRGRRKEARPVATKTAMHVTLRATRATGTWSLLRKANARIVNELITRVGKKWRVRVYERANVGNHIHLLLRAESRAGFANFVRVLSAQIAMRVTGARRGRSIGGRFWDLTAWSRIVEGDFVSARRYVVKNRLEAAGLVAYTPRSGSIVRDVSSVSVHGPPPRLR